MNNIERVIVRAFVEDTITAGYRVAVSSDRGYDTEDMLLGSTNIKEIMETVFAGDEAHLFVQPAVGPVTTMGKVSAVGWVYFTLGEGADVICDYTINDVISTLIARANSISDEAHETF